MSWIYLILSKQKTQSWGDWAFGMSIPHTKIVDTFSL